MVNKETFIVVQARMGSERLPGKVLKEIDGIPMIGHQFKRLQQSGYPIILATSTNEENDPLVSYTESLGIEVFRGSESNVLERYYKSLEGKNCKTVVRVTGDNPLVDGELMHTIVEEYNQKENENLYQSTGKSKTYPLGISFEIFSFAMLEEAYNNAKHPGEFEHVTPYIHQNVSGKVIIESLKYKVDRNHYRLTVDTEDDFKLLDILIVKYRCHEKTVDEIVKILDGNIELAAINSEVVQKKWNE